MEIKITGVTLEELCSLEKIFKDQTVNGVSMAQLLPEGDAIKEDEETFYRIFCPKSIKLEKFPKHNHLFEDQPKNFTFAVTLYVTDTMHPDMTPNPEKLQIAIQAITQSIKRFTMKGVN